MPKNNYKFKIFITRLIPDQGLKMLQDKGYEVRVSAKDRVLTKREIITELKKGYDALLALLTDEIDSEIIDAGLGEPKFRVVRRRRIRLWGTPAAEIRACLLYTSPSPRD